MTDAAPDNFLTLEWADGDYTFRLPVGQIGELQTKCSAGVGEIYKRLMAGRYIDRATGEIVMQPLQAEFRYEDITETIRLGLIGGDAGLVNGEQIKVSPTKAQQLVRDYVHTRPLLENWKVAGSILSAFIIGYTDPEQAQKKSQKQAKAATPGTAKAGSTST